MLVKDGEIISKIKQTVKFDEDNDNGKLREIFAIGLADGELDEMALVVEHGNTNDLVTVYPCVTDGTLLPLKITKIHEWGDKIEAVIEGEYEHGDNTVTFCFFDTHYFENKGLYEVGSTYDFKLSFMAYSAKVLKETTFSFEGQQAIDFLTKIGNKPHYDENGNVEPVTIKMDRMVFFLSTDKENPDDVEYQSPVAECGNIVFRDIKYYKLKMKVYDEGETQICLPLYARADLFEQQPQTDDPVIGEGWIQGFLNK